MLASAVHQHIFCSFVGFFFFFLVSFSSLAVQFYSFLYGFCLRVLLRKAFPNSSLYKYSPIFSSGTFKLLLKKFNVSFILI